MSTSRTPILQMLAEVFPTKRLAKPPKTNPKTPPCRVSLERLPVRTTSHDLRADGSLVPQGLRKTPSPDTTSLELLQHCCSVVSKTTLEVLEPVLQKMTKLQEANSKYRKLLRENPEALRDNQKAMERLTKALGKEVKPITTGDDGPREKKRKWGQDINYGSPGFTNFIFLWLVYVSLHGVGRHVGGVLWIW